MNTNATIDELTEKISQLFSSLPGAASQAPKLRALLNGALSNLDVVSREEFDAQKAVLARTRQQLTELEHTLEQLSSAKPPENN